MAKGLTELNDKVAINRRNINIIQQIQPKSEDYKFGYKITLIGGVYCEFDSNLNMKQVEKLCDI